MAAVLDQDSFRIRNDDGNETTATWKAAANTGASLEVDTNWRIRFLIQNTGDATKSTNGSQGWQLQYNLNSAGWNDVNASSSVVISSASPNLADNTSTTQQLGAGTFDAIAANKFDEVDGRTLGAVAQALSNGQETEVEYCWQLRSADVANNDSIQLRVVYYSAGNTAFDTYTNTPTITVVEGGAPANLRRYTLSLSGVG